MSERHACRLLGQGRGTQRYEGIYRADEDALTRAIIALASEDEAAPESLVNFGFSEAFKKPFDIALLAEHIQTLVEERRANS